MVTNKTNKTTLRSFVTINKNKMANQRVKEFRSRVEKANILERYMNMPVSVNPFPRMKFKIAPEFHHLFYSKKCPDLSGRVPKCVLSYIPTRIQREEKALVHDLLYQYASAWMDHCFSLFPGEEVIKKIGRRFWDSYETFDDYARWMGYAGQDFVRIPFVYLHRADANYILRCGVEVWRDEYWSPTHFFTPSYDDLFEYGFAGTYSFYSLVPLLKIRKDRFVAEKQVLNEFVRDVKRVRRELEAARSHDTSVFCVKCGTIAGVCEYCVDCCPHSFRDHHPRGRVQFFTVKHSVEFSGLNQIVNSITDKLGARLDDVGRRAMIGLPLCLAGLWRHRNWADWSIALGAYLNAVGFMGALSSSIMARAKQVYELLLGIRKKSGYTTIWDDEDEGIWSRFKSRFAKAQSSGVTSSAEWVLGGVGGILTIALAAIGLRRVPDTKEVTNYVMKFAALGRCVNSIEKLYEVGERFAELVMRLIRVHIFKQDPKIVVDFHQIDDWCSRVASLIDTNLESKIKYNLEMKTKIDSLLKEGDDLIKYQDKLHIPMVQRVRFTKLYDQLSRVRALVATSGAGHAELRVNPIVVHLVGDTGSGKSSVLWPLFMDVLARMGIESYEKALESVYFRYSGDGNKNWDGYHNGVRIVSVDDAFTKKDSETSPCQDVDEIIRMNNNACWPLPMAHLADKGITHFGANLITYSSNQSHFNFPSRTNPEAVTSRFNLKYRVRPLPEFSQKVKIGEREVVRLDRLKISDRLREDPESICSFVEFVKLDPMSDFDDEGEVLTYGQFVDEVWTEMRRNEARFEMMSDGLKKRFDRARVQGLFTRKETTRRKPVGCVAGDRVGWLDWWRGQAHYNPYVLFKEFATFCGDSWRSPLRGDIDYCVDPPEVNKCLHVEGALTRNEAMEFVSILLAEENSDFWAFHVANSTFGNRVRQCDKHNDCVFGEKEMTEVERTRRYLMKNAVERQLDNIDLTYSRDETVLTEIGMFITTFVVTFITVCGAAIITSWLSPENKTPTMRERVRAARAESRQERDQGRKSGRVESSGAGGHLTHSQECVAAFEEFAGLFDKWMEDKEYNFESVSGFTDIHGVFRCACSEGKIQSILDQNAAEVSAVSFQNLYKLERRVGEKWVALLNVLFVAGRMALCNKHLLLDLKTHPDDRYRIVNVTRPSGYEFSIKDLRYRVSTDPKHAMKDLVLLEFPLRVHQHRDIRDKFISIEEQGRCSELEAVCVSGHLLGCDAPIIRQYFSDSAVCVDQELVLYDDDERPRVTLRNYIKYKIQTSEGDCGGIVVAYDKRIRGKIVGIHAGGFDHGPYAGIAQPVSRETIDDMLKGFRCRFPDSLVACDPPVDSDPEVLLVGDLIVPSDMVDGEQCYGRVQSGVFAVAKTQIRPSPLHGVLAKPTTAPARLSWFTDSNGNRVHPMDLARKKVHVREPPKIDQNLMNRCIDDYWQVMQYGIREDDQRILSLEEGIAGVQGDEYYSPLNRKSSPGYGWPTGGGKRKYLGDDEYVFDHPEVVARHSHAMDNLNRGVRLNAVFQDTLKDERRDLKRVEEGKTRLFSAGEMIFTIIFRQFFMGWTAHMMRNKIDVESCVGLNPLGSDWHYLATGLMRSPSSLIAGDFSNYDASLSAEVLWGVFELVQRFYGVRDHRRLLLWSDVVNSWHVNGDRILLWSQSNPSGCPVTSVLNSVAHSLMARYVFILCAERWSPRDANFLSFRKYVVHRNFGDDDLWAVSYECPWLTQDALTWGFDLVGMKYTDESKTGSRGMRSLTEVSFLKRGFRYDLDICRWVAPLALDVIYEMPMWLHSSSDVYMQTVEVLENSFRELALHAEDVYTANVPNFLKAVKKLYPHRVYVVPRAEVLLAVRCNEFK